MQSAACLLYGPFCNASQLYLVRAVASLTSKSQVAEVVMVINTVIMQHRASGNQPHVLGSC